MQENNLTGEIPASIGNLRGLEYLYLYNNDLTGPIPMTFFNLVNLGSFAASNNDNVCLPASMTSWHSAISETDYLPQCPPGVSIESDELPEKLTLAPNYPNPFNPSTTVTYTLARSGPVELSVYDLTGRVVSSLVDGVQPAGHHEVRFDADGLPTGTYIYRLRAGAETLTRTMTLVR